MFKSFKIFKVKIVNISFFSDFYSTYHASCISLKAEGGISSRFPRCTALVHTWNVQTHAGSRWGIPVSDETAGTEGFPTESRELPTFVIENIDNLPLIEREKCQKVGQ